MVAVSAGVPTGPGVPTWDPPPTVADRLDWLENNGVALQAFFNAALADPWGQAFVDAYAVLAAQGGGKLRLPSNTLMTIGQSVVPCSNSTMTGDVTSVIQAKPGTSMAVIRATDVDNVHVVGPTIDGNQSNVTGGNGIIFEGVQNFSIRNVWVQYAWNNGILLDYTTRPCKTGRVAQPHVKGCGSAAAFALSGGHAIAFSGNAGVAGSGPIDVEVVAPVLEDNYSSGVNLSQCTNCSVTGGGAINSTAANSTGYAGVRCSNGSKGCTVTGFKAKNISRGFYITANAASGASEQNVFAGVRAEGAYFQGALISASYTNFSGQIVNCCVGAADGAIRLAAVGSPQTDVKHCTIGPAVIIDTNGSPNHAYGVRSLDAAPGVCDYNTFTGLTILGFQTDDMSVPGLHNRVAGVVSAQVPDRPSAATLVLRDSMDRFHITGEVTITAIDAAARRQDRAITLMFNTNLTCTLTAGASLRMAGGANFVATKYDSITLVYNITGDYWFEIARSVNA